MYNINNVMILNLMRKINNGVYYLHDQYIQNLIEKTSVYNPSCLSIAYYYNQ